jgi:hypothetical protein
VRPKLPVQTIKKVLALGLHERVIESQHDPNRVTSLTHTAELIHGSALTADLLEGPRLRVTHPEPNAVQSLLPDKP